MRSHEFADPQAGSEISARELSPEAARFAEVFLPILVHARQDDPRECCGFVFEVDGKLKIWKTRNAADSPSEFFIDPHDQYVAICCIERQNGEIVAIYHSHPFGTPTPSERDCAFAKLWPGIAMLIAAKGVVRAYDASGTAL